MVVLGISTGTLVINPAFLQEIKDSNPGLSDTLADLRHILRGDDSAAQICCKLARALDDLREHLSLQFSLEESYGYLSVPEAPDLVLSEWACRAQSQHKMLYMQLTDLAEQAEELQYRGVELAPLRALLQSASEFESELGAHEESELELIERAFDLHQIPSRRRKS